MPLSIEAMSPKWTVVGVSLVISFAVGTLERMRAWFALLGFQSRRVNFSVSFAAPTELSMVFRLVWAITFNALCPLYPARESGMSPFPAIFALGNSGIHVCSSDGSDIVADIEASVYKHFSIMSALNVPYVYPDNCHVRLWRNFDYSWF